MERFPTIGQYVRVNKAMLHPDLKDDEIGQVVRRNGEYIYVRLVESGVEMELYRGEINEVELPKTYQDHLDSCVYAVEATSCEQLDIWERFCSDESPLPVSERYEWNEIVSWLETVGRLDDRPICVCFRLASLDGYPICFWEPTSELVDHRMIDRWFESHAPNLRRTNAMNVHNAIHKVRRLAAGQEE